MVQADRVTKDISVLDETDRETGEKGKSYEKDERVTTVTDMPVTAYWNTHNGVHAVFAAVLGMFLHCEPC